LEVKINQSGADLVCHSITAWYLGRQLHKNPKAENCMGSVLSIIVS